MGAKNLLIVIGAIVAMVQPLAGQSCCGDPNCMLREIYSPVLVGEGGGLVGQTLFKLDCPPGPGCGLELEMFDAQGNPITEAILNGTTAVLPSNIQLDSGETDIDIITSPSPIAPRVAVFTRSGGCAQIQGSYEIFNAQGDIIESYNELPATPINAADGPLFGLNFARGVATQELGTGPQRQLAINVYNPDPRPTDEVFVGSQREGQEFFATTPANTAVLSRFFGEAFEGIPDPACTEMDIGMQFGGGFPMSSSPTTQGTTERKVYVTLISVVGGGTNFQFKPVPLKVVER